MCGFVGFHSAKDFPQGAAALVQEMANRIAHRGPDDHGQWTNPALGTALASRRLAILDLSELGHQPMVSPDGRFALAFNGEIYNHLVLRADLGRHGYKFRGHSDTEVLLAGVSSWGLETTLKQCVGMFALALVDVRERRLYLARDRLGEKPLYFGWDNGHFFFGSELKAFRPHPGFDPKVDRRSLALYLRYGYVPSPYCILQGFHKLSPGHILSMPLDGSAGPGSEKIQPYWVLPAPGSQAPFQGSAEECAERLNELLRDSIRMQMLADVPVGAFLSGGIDSSTVVSLMQAQATSPVRTFTISFPDAPFDESPHAEKVARHLGTNHTTWLCADSELLDLAAQLPKVYCEPFADDSQVPTLALTRLARQQVTVALSGDGGDELFHGYRRYARAARRWQQVRSVPGLGLAWRCGINAGSTGVALLPDSLLKRQWLNRLARARSQWIPKNLPALYRYRMSMHKASDLYLTQPETPPDFFDAVGEMTTLPQDAALLSYVDLHTYLPDDLLVKVDRAAMAFSLETRLPLLDHRIVEFAQQIPVALKWKDQRSKWPLRAVLARSVPPALTERPKSGFTTPLGRWLRGPLREWAEHQLAMDRLRQEGFFDPEALRQLWNQHQHGCHDRAPMLWGVLMFQAWHETFCKSTDGRPEVGALPAGKR